MGPEHPGELVTEKTVMCFSLEIQQGLYMR